MIDFLRYDELKKNGGLTLQAVGAQAVVFVRKFHPNTGKELLPDMGPIDVQATLKQRENQAKVLAGIDAMLSDIKALGVSIEPEKTE